ncbi:hypothetical protein OROHE_011397 [Orobanche hederae]
MADKTSDCEISALEQNLLQDLYKELDAEREASASAATEALSVILCLQGEKAAVKLEAEQYKRLSDEKMSHAEESLAIVEGIIYQKEMEIAALDCQVQAYRYKLLSLGCADFSLGHTKFRDSPFQEKNENLGRRNSSELNSFRRKNVVNERDGSCLQKIDLVSNIVEEKKSREILYQVSDLGKKTDSCCIDSYWEQIRKLDVRVKELAGANYINSRSDNRFSSSIGGDKLYDQNDELLKGPASNLVKNDVAVDYPCYPSIHDVFEVPQIDKNESHIRKDVVHPEAVEETLYVRDEPDWMKKFSKDQLSEPGDYASTECHSDVGRNFSESRCRSYQLNRTSETVRVERPVEFTNRDEESKLLNEIKERLNILHEAIRGRNVKEYTKKDEPSLCALSQCNASLLALIRLKRKF